MPDFAGFVGPSYIAASITQDDQELLNMYIEQDATKEPGERGYQSLYPTPGLKLFAIAGLGPIRGLWVIPGGSLMFAVSGNALYQITNTLTAPTGVVGLLQTSSGPVSMTDNGTNLFIADGSTRYTYVWPAGPFSIQTDGAFLGADIFDNVDTFVIYNKPASNLWGATSAGLATSPSLSFGVKDSTPDNIVSLIVNRREVYLFGERTTEIWSDEGLFPFPFQRLDGASMQHGCVAKFSVSRLGESFAWLAQDSRGEAIVVTMQGTYTPARISTHAVEQDIAKFSSVSDATAFTYQQGGHEFYVLNFPSGDRTWVYDLATGFWHKRGWRDANNIIHRHRASCMAFFQNQAIVGDWQNGNLYFYSQTKFVDEVATLGGSFNATPMQRIRRCPHITQELKRQFFHEFQIQFQPGVGLQTGQGSQPQAMLKWSDDGGSTWSNEHWVSIGKTGAYKNRARWTELGEARDRIFEVTVTDPVYGPIVSANLITSLGAT